ncbi:MAG: hypothetical protein AB1896_17135 [Thermodesulfobacteriota bacterium]
MKRAPAGGPKKHDCPDCFFCQGCSDTRCNTCRGNECRPVRRSMAEQIAAFDRLNQDDPHPPGQPLRII